MSQVSLYVLGLLLAQPAPGSTSSSPDVVWARVQQDELPQWEARRATAEARIAAAQRYFDGSTPLERAFPDLDGAPLGTRAWLEGRLAKLDERGVARAAERNEHDPDLGSNVRLAQWRRTKNAALDAEEHADALLRRLLLAHVALLESHPQLSDDAVDQLLQPIDARITLARQRWEGATGEAHTRAAEEVAIAVERRRVVLTLVGELRREATVPGTQPVDLDPALDALRGSYPEDGLAMLKLARPLASDTVAARIDTALVSWLTGPALQTANARLEAARTMALPNDAAEVGLIAKDAQQTLAEIEQRIDSLKGETGPVAEAEQRLLAVRRDAAQLRLERAREAQQSTTVRTVDANQEASEARKRAELARARALEARASASDETSERTADVLVAAAEAQLVEARLWDETESIQKELDEEYAGFTQRFEAIRDVEDANHSFRASRELLNDLQEATVSDEVSRRTTHVRREASVKDHEADRTEIAELRGRAFALPPPVDPYLAALDVWEENLNQQERALTQREHVLTDHRTRLLNLQRELRGYRQQLRPRVSADILWDDRANLPGDIWAELQFALPHFWTEELNRVEGLLSLPRHLISLRAAWELFKDSLGLLFGLLVWWWSRRRVETLVTAVVDRWVNRRGELFAPEIRSVEKPAVPFARALIDLTAVIIAIVALRGSLPEVSLVLLVVAQVVGYRAALLGFSLLIGKKEEPRPALASLEPERYQLAERTVRLAVLWLIGRQFTHYVLARLMRADLLATLAMLVFWALLAGLVLWALHAWEPHLQGAVRKGGGESRIIHLLTGKPHRNVLLRWLYALTDLGVLVSRGFVSILQGQFKETTVVGRLFMILDRYRMTESTAEEESLPPLPDELHEQLVAQACPDELYIDRPQADEKLIAAFEGWQLEKRRGVIALVGDRGEGKRTWLERTCARLEADEQPTVRVRMDRRLSNATEVIRWLSNSLELGETTDGEALHAALAEREPTLFVLEECHLAFLRAVGGFEGLRTLLHVISSNDERHCWLLTMHRPAWWYLKRVEDVLDVDIFREVIELKPMDEKQLRDLVIRRTAAAGYEPTFQRLLRRSPVVHGRYDDDLEQATKAYFRLLEDASAGNPGVALQLWSQSLAVREQDTGHCEVNITTAIRDGAVPELGETELFNLAALRLQDTLAVDELARVNNMRAAQIHVSLEVLHGYDLIWRNDSQVGINLKHLPAITRVLKRRQFLQWRD